MSQSQPIRASVHFHGQRRPTGNRRHSRPGACRHGYLFRCSVPLVGGAEEHPSRLLPRGRISWSTRTRPPSHQRWSVSCCNAACRNERPCWSSRPACRRASCATCRRIRRPGLGRRTAAAPVAGLGHRGTAQRRALRHRGLPRRPGQGHELADPPLDGGHPGGSDLRRSRRVTPARAGGSGARRRVDRKDARGDQLLVPRSPPRSRLPKAIAASVTDDLPVNTPTTTDRTVSRAGRIVGDRRLVRGERRPAGDRRGWLCGADVEARARLERRHTRRRTRSSRPCTRPEPGRGAQPVGRQCSDTCGGRLAIRSGSLSIFPTFAAPPGEPSSSKKSTLAWV